MGNNKQKSIQVSAKIYPPNDRALRRTAKNLKKTYNWLLNEAIAQFTGGNPAELEQWRKSND